MARVWKRVARRAAAPYLAGPRLSDALRECQALETAGLGGTLCYWNRDDESPRQVAGACVSALEALALSGLSSCLSLKAPAFDHDRGLLWEIVSSARPAHRRLQFDSLAPEAADRTFDLVARAASRYSRVGCTLPARWARSAGDAERVADLGLLVRIVKGQWPDPRRDVESRTGFLSIVDRLAGRARHVSVATHDVELSRESLRRLTRAGTSCELELLYGLPGRAAMRMARGMNVPIRIYVPYGYGWPPYAFGPARRNPRVLWWLARDLVRCRGGLIPDNA